MSKKYAIFAGLGVVVIAALFFGNFDDFFRSSPVKNAPVENTVDIKIVAFGDSLVQGVGATEGNDFVSLVSVQIGQPIVNLSKSGDTTRSALTRLDLVLAESPRVVILLLGGNDYLQRIPKEETFANLGTIISRLQEKGAAVLLLGVRGGALRDTYETDFTELARTYKTGYVSNVLDGLLNDRTLMSDAIHPNNAGYNIIADRVTKELRKSVLR